MKAAHIAPFDAMIRNYLGLDSDLTGDESLVYYASVLNFDTVPAVMLPYLAKMFGVDGFKGFDFAPTEALKRQTLKRAVLMKRRHGTPWCMKRVLENAGFQYVEVIDHIPGTRFWDGSLQFDGSQQFNSSHWAHFRIEMEPPIGVLAEDVDLDALRILINYWKRACTLCVDIWLKQIRITDFGIGDDPQYFFDGSEQFDGSRQFGV